VIVVEARVAHPERTEDLLLGEPPQRLPAHALDEDRREEEPRVAVEELLARREVEHPLPRDDVERLVIGREIGVVDPGEIPESEVVAQPTGVRKQVADRHRLLVRRQLGDELPHVVVELELPLPREQHHGHRGELLGRRADVENRLRRQRDAELQVRHPVAAGVRDLPVAEDADRAPG
jgi:hypothetical protein